MAMHWSKKKLLLLLLQFVCGAEAAIEPSPKCPTSCGHVAIPFPFGTTEDCSLDASFLVHCNETATTPTPYLSQRNHNLSVLSISTNGEIRVSLPVTTTCFYDNGTQKGPPGNQFFGLTRQFSISSVRNKLTAVGCNSVGVVGGTDSKGKKYTTGCVSLCYRFNDTTATKGLCSGTGCCQTQLPGRGLPYSFLSYGSTVAFVTNNHSDSFAFTPCHYGFVAEDGAYEFLFEDIKRFEKKEFPVVLDWAVGNQSCRQAKKGGLSYACKADNSECFDSVMGYGYVCNCSSGFRGNPYLLHACKDVNECVESNDCYHGATCHNLFGSYTCSCPKGYQGDGKKNGTKCRRKSKTQVFLIISLSVSVGVVALLVLSFYVYWRMKKRKLVKLKEQFFQQNGGLLLQQQIANYRGSTETAKVYTVEELKNATNNFDECKILGKGGQGTVYKGLLPDGRIVAIKKSKISDPSQIEQFINEVVVLSQINHRNVVKLLGCCLETEFPLLVYEFISNGTIFDHLHSHHNQSLRLDWKTRLRIAAEASGALAYLHSAASMPIIHRDVKTANILLDYNLTAKVADFGASRIVPLDQNQLTTLVQGTLGYLDPEYFRTSHLTEKSDVYSFGVVLAELLTGRKALSFAVPETERNLALYFFSSVNEGRLLGIVDSCIVDEAEVEQLTEFANVAQQCLRLNREERPTMKEVAMELERLRVEKKHIWESNKLSSEETEKLLQAYVQF